MQYAVETAWVRGDENAAPHVIFLKVSKARFDALHRHLLKFKYEPIIMTTADSNTQLLITRATLRLSERNGAGIDVV